MKLAPLFALTIVACGGSAKPVPPSTRAFDVTTYYLGTSQVWKPDRSSTYGPETDAVLQRVVSPQRQLIVETALVDGEPSTITLSQRPDDPNVFTPAAGDGLTGTLTFIGPAWAWTGWDYDLTLDTGKITGHADITDTEISAELHLVDAAGIEQALIVEHMVAVPEAEFVAKREALRSVTTYYEGTATQWSADHRTAVGTQSVLRKRTLKPATGEIYDSLVVDGSLVTDIYDRTDDVNVFTLEQHDGLSGTRTLGGPAWAWTSYDDELVADGMAIHIHGEVTADGITSTSTIEAGGTVAAVLETSYRAISEEEFRAKLGTVKAP